MEIWIYISDIHIKRTKTIFIYNRTLSRVFNEVHSQFLTRGQNNLKQ